MKKPTIFSFRRKRKDDQSLLANSDVHQPTDLFKRIDAEETRNDENDGSSWLPYQIATQNEESNDMESIRDNSDVSPAHYLLDEVSRAEGSSWKGDNFAMESKPPARSKAKAAKSNVLSMNVTHDSSGDDVFDDLESIKDRVVSQVDSLEDIMNDKNILLEPIDKKNTFASFKIDTDSSEVSQQRTQQSAESNILDLSTESLSTEGSGDLPIDPRLLKKRGILIVDPQNNGEIYRMDENHKNLTDKELIIIGLQRASEQNEEDDDQTLMSSLTEVTYQRSKEERVNYIMQHLKDAASQIPESRAWCGMFQCPPDFAEDEGIGGFQKDANLVKRDTRDTKPSMTQNANMLFNSLYAVSSKGGRGKKVELGNFSESIVVCITRIYLSLQDGENDGLRCTFNEPKLCHDLGVRLKEASDGRAIVVDILPESTAERSGVKIGDVLSVSVDPIVHKHVFEQKKISHASICTPKKFAVPLNNTFQGYEKACDFISRLELIGMRTSYREIFDMFLSKTSAGWPVATVFRRGSVGVQNFEDMPFGLLSVDMHIDLSRASSFFHEIVTKSREYDYHRESNAIYETVRGNIETFIPKPGCRTLHRMKILKSRRIDVIGEKAQSFGLETKRDTRSILLPKTFEENFHQSMFFAESRRSSLLTWYTENSDAIIYLKISGTFGGSGVTVTRIKEGSWSAPCAVGANINGCSFRLHADPIECMIFVRDLHDLDEFKKGKETILGGNEQKESVVIMTKIADAFCIEADMRCTLFRRHNLNELLYSSSNNVDPTSEMILQGKFQSPSEAIVFGGALRRLELPSTMYPHPTPPKNLVKFNANDWTVESSCKVSGLLDPPFDENTITTLRQLLDTFDNGESVYDEDLNEFEVFAQKFKQMLYDGVTIDRAWPLEEGKDDHDGSFMTKVTLKLHSRCTQSGREDFLLFVAKSRVAAIGSKCDFSCPSELPKNKCLSESLDLCNIVKVTQNEPKFAQSNTSLQKGRKRRKRFVSLKTKDGKRVPFLARTGKDASLLACGLKLLVERIQKHRHRDKFDSNRVCNEN